MSVAIIALVAAVVAEHVTRAPARNGVLAVVAELVPLDLDVLAALVAIALVAAVVSGGGELDSSATSTGPRSSR